MIVAAIITPQLIKQSPSAWINAASTLMLLYAYSL